MNYRSKKSSWLSRRELLKTSLASAVGHITPRFLRRSGQPVSATPSVVWMWSGALTSSSIVIKAQVSAKPSSLALVVSKNPNLSDPVRTNPMTFSAADGNRYIGKGQAGSLDPTTTYYYGIRVNNQLQEQRGKFFTAGAGAYSFKIAFGSCAETGSNHQVFDMIRQHNPLFFIHLGDLYYADITQDSTDAFHERYRKTLISPNQSALYREVPIVYMWDDHDYGDNNSDRYSNSRTSARFVYQQNVPHYPLVSGSGNVPIYQAFTIGRVRFIVTDSRSRRTPATEVDTIGKSVTGQTQKKWLKQELLNARDSHSAIVWVCTTPWLDEGGPDTWNAYATERRDIADFIVENDIDNLCYISGDAHMLAIDDGSNNRYSTSGVSSFPIMQAASLDQIGYYLPTTRYSHGQYPGRGQFGVMDVIDEGVGRPIKIQWRGRNYLNQEVVSHDFTLNRQARIGTSLPELVFTVYSGTASRSDARQFKISNLTDIGPFNWSISADSVPDWLSFSAMSGSGATTVTAVADATGRALGVLHGSVQINVSGAVNSPVTLPVSLLFTDKRSAFLPAISE